MRGFLFNDLRKKQKTGLTEIDVHNTNEFLLNPTKKIKGKSILFYANNNKLNAITPIPAIKP